MIHGLAIKVGEPSPHLQLVSQQLNRVFRIFLTKAAKEASNSLNKTTKLLKSFDAEEEAKAAFDAIKWDDIYDDVVSDLSAAYEISGLEAVSALHLDRVQEATIVNTSAVAYAQKRGAEMIGKRLVDGELVDNPNAKFVISETTREDIKDIIEYAFEKKIELSEIQELIKESGSFSAKRASLISKTEIALAQVQGNLSVWKNSGIVQSVNILLSGSHPIEDVCDELVAKGPYPIHAVPMIPAHPHCQCIISAHELKEK